MEEPNQKIEPVTNPVLVDAMATFKLDLKNREHEIAFLKAALEAKYLLPAKIEQLPGEATEDGKIPSRIAFQVMTNPKGDKFMPAFTDEIELRKTRKPDSDEPLQIAVVDFRALHNFVKQNEGINGVVINPLGSALCLVCQQIIAIGDNDFKIVVAPPRQQTQFIDLTTQQAQPAQPTQPTNAVGAPEDDSQARADMIRQAMANMEASDTAENTEETGSDPISDELLSALKTTLKKQKAVKKAYIKADVENGERYLLIALDADDSADLEKIGETVSEECKDYSDLPFECVPSTNIRAKSLVADEKPFYEKKRFGIF